MSRLPDLAALRLLVDVARHGSIGAAARSHGVTQQSASERLRAIEAQVGLPLVQRSTRGSTLTPSGVVLVEWAARLLDLADEIETALDGLRGDRGRDLTVWASMTVAESLVPRWLVRLREQQVASSSGQRGTPTAVHLTAANSEAVAEAVRERGIHLGFVEGATAPTGLRSTAVARDELVLVAQPGSPLTRRRQVRAVEVATLALTTREPGSGTREVVEQALARHDLVLPASVVELSTNTAIREAVIAGGPPAFLSRRVVARDLDAGSLALVPTPELDLGRVFRAVWLGGSQPPPGPVRDLVAIARSQP